MKHLKLFESFREEDIYDICKEYGIENYTINRDGSIDVDGNVVLAKKRFITGKLPLNFRNVSGSFDCNFCTLTTLEGCPKSVGENFQCGFNQLTSLEGCSRSVGRDFDCFNNQLTSLEGCPKSVGRDFYCDHNEIVTFEYLPLSIGGDFYCVENPIYQVWKLFWDYSKIEFLNDCDALREPDDDSEPIIILNRLNYFLEEVVGKTVTNVEGYKCVK